MNPNKYGLTGKMKAKPGKGNELGAILLQASKLVSTAKGLHLYIVSMDAEAPDVIHVAEVWDSKTDHDNSLQLPGVKELISQAMPIIEGKPEGAILEVLGGKGLE
jgi:quinol monooxygenase YgiN